MARDTGRSAVDAGLEALYSPRSILLYGATDDPGNPGGQVVRNLLSAGFGGAIHPISSTRESVGGIASVKSLPDVPDGVDLAVIGIRAESVAGVVRECGSHGVKAALILSSGYSEVGNTGLQAELASSLAESGMRAGGPNCGGYLNLADSVSANFAAWKDDAPLPRSGPVAVISQSAGFGMFVTRGAMSAGLGVNWMIATGNEVDVSVSTAIGYTIERDDVRVVLGIAETIKDMDELIAVARRAAELDKPVVILKPGRSEASQKAALTHTAAVASSGAAFDAVCRQYGVHVAMSLDDLVDLARVFSDGRRAGGRRVGVITGSGGTGVVVTDALALAGLELPAIPDKDQTRMLEVLPENFLGSLANPVDISAQAAVVANPYEAVLECLAGSEVIDVLVPVAFANVANQVSGARSVYRRTDKPMVVLASAAMPEASPTDPPALTDTRRVAHAVAALVRQSYARARPSCSPPTARPRPSAAQRVISDGQGHPFLLEHDAAALLGAYGVPAARSVFVTSPAQAAAAFGELGVPSVVLKVMSYDAPHKTDVAGVQLGLTSPDVVERAAQEMLERFAAPQSTVRVSGFLVQAMVPARLELTCGLNRDPVCGPMVVVGIGGVLVELVQEVAMLRAPFDASIARSTIEGLLDGRVVSAARGLSSTEVDSIAEIAVAVGRIALDYPQISSIDINPVRVADGAAFAADAMVVFA